MMPRFHLAVCDYCGKRIAWSRKRRQWLALAPLTTLRGGPLRRRIRCTASVTSLHDPTVNLAERYLGWVRGGGR